MAYIAPTVADFRARFPEMGEVSDGLVSLVLAEALLEVGEAWPDQFRAPAQLYLTAHILAEEGGPDRSGAARGQGRVTSESIGPATTTFGPSGGGVVAYQIGRNYTATPYGRRYAELRNIAFPTAMMVV